MAKDVADWLPELNQCWYVNRSLEVRREYGLTVDLAEANAIDDVLANCDSTEMFVLGPGDAETPTTTDNETATATPTQSPQTTPAPSSDTDALSLYDDNGNGRITCAEARTHGIAPVHRGHSAYESMRDADGDGDGVVCE